MTPRSAPIRRSSTPRGGCIANGSGSTVSEVNQLVDRFFEARKMMSRWPGDGHAVRAAARSPRTAGKNNKARREGRRGRRRRRCAQPLESPGGLPGGFPGSVADAGGLNELPPGLAGLRSVEAEVPRQNYERAACCTFAAGTPTASPSEWWIADGVLRSDGRSPAPKPSSTAAGSFRTGRRALPRRTGATRRAPIEQAVARRGRTRAVGALLMREVRIALTTPAPR